MTTNIATRQRLVRRIATQAFSSPMKLTTIEFNFIITFVTFVAQLVSCSEPISQYTAVFADQDVTMAPLRQLNRTLFNPALYSRLREVWFGNLPYGSKGCTKEAKDRWFTGSKDQKAQFDSLCFKEFHPAIEAISPDEYPIKDLPAEQIIEPFLREIESHGDGGGDESAKTALSLFILLDQIPRNLFRTKDTLKLVYAHYDPIALALARHITSTSPRLDLLPSIRKSIPYRQWFYLPLMHSEDLSDHRKFSVIMDEFAKENEGDEEVMEQVRDTVKFEDFHVQIVEKFGRYPHRNEGLGRESTEEEKAYMKEGGHNFGVGEE